MSASSSTDPPAFDPAAAADLTASLKGLEASFANAEKKLDRVEWEVDQKISAAAQTKPVTSESVSELLRSFRGVKSDYESLLKEVGELQAAQEAAVKAVLSQVQEMAGSVASLKGKYGDQAEKSSQGET